MRFLIADDDASTRIFLRMIIEENGDEVIEAESGEDAVNCFQRQADIPDIIIMDVVMPGCGGLHAARQIRNLLKSTRSKQDIYIPIIFLTGTTSEAMLTECLAVGDDVMQKPISAAIAEAKIRSLKRHVRTFDELLKQRQALEKNQQIIDKEHELARNIFSHFMKMNNLGSGNLRIHTSPTSTFNGDIVLCARSPMDSLYVFVGDLTGHGLPAAIAAIPINKIFFAMACKGIAISAIAREINNTLHELLPENIFCAAHLLEMRADGRQVKIWSGGMPSILVSDRHGMYKQKIPCLHMPLGSQAAHEFESSIDTVALTTGDKLYLYTDGVTESCDADGNLLGDNGLRQLFSRDDQADRFQQILNLVEHIAVNREEQDDVTLVEISAVPLAWGGETSKDFQLRKTEELQAAMPWTITMHLTGRDFQRGDPSSQIIQFLSQATGVDIHQDILSTVLTELYSNALEHGLLKLDSNLKASDDGFVEYYLNRSEGITRLDAERDSIDIEVRFIPDKLNPRIIIAITDSGEGFEMQTLPAADEDELHGRGQKLLRSLCDNLVYSNGGRTATATYQLLKPH